MDFFKKIFWHLDILIPTALTIYGWRFVYREGNRLARRNETQSLFQITRKVLDDTNKAAESIWMATSGNLSELDEAKLSAYCAEFELCLSKMRAHYCEVAIDNKEIYILRRALSCSPYPVAGQAATSEVRIKIISTLISEMSLTLIQATYEQINT